MVDMTQDTLPTSVADSLPADAADPGLGGLGTFTSPLADLLSAGGPVLYLLAGLSVLTLALIVAKALQFSAARIGRRSRRGALARVRTATQKALKLNLPTGQIEKAGLMAARQELRPLEVGVSFLGMIAMLSPLIGLLGTVIGMIDAFRALEEAGSSVNPSLLSSGIWVALLTTAAGLIVAIPATLAHGWFEGRLSRFADLAEEVIARVMETPQTSGTAAPVGGVAQDAPPRRLGLAAD